MPLFSLYFKCSMKDKALFTWAMLYKKYQRQKRLGLFIKDQFNFLSLLCATDTSRHFECFYTPPLPSPDPPPQKKKN